MEILLWALLAMSLSLLIYPFALYPLILAGMARVAPRPAVPPAEAAPKPAAILIAARDEAAALPATLAWLARARARHPGLEILVWNDGSRDGTGAQLDAAARRLALRLVHAPRPVGKSAALARLSRMATAPILVFMDANVTVPEDGLDRLLARFADPDVGAVSAVSRTGGAAAPVARRYWALEERIKAWESLTGSTMGCDGAFWAIRTALYRPPEPGMSDDFGPSMGALAAGARVISAADLVVHEAAVPDDRIFARTARIACGAWHAHRAVWPGIRARPARDRFKYISHKLIRWFAGLWLALAGAAAAALSVLHGQGDWMVATLLLGIGALWLDLPPAVVARRGAEALLGTS